MTGNKQGKRGFNWIGLIAFIVIAAILVCLMGWMTAGFKDWSFRFGHNSEQEDKKSEEPGSSTVGIRNGELVVTTEPETEGTLLRIRARALSEEDTQDEFSVRSYQLVATVLPEDATDKSLDWTAAFKNAQSEWAQGKQLDSYLTLTVSEDTHTVTVNCPEPFAEQIEITATSRSTPEVTASCTADYLSSVSVKLDLPETFKASETTTDLTNSELYTFTYGVGTKQKQPELTVKSVDYIVMQYNVLKASLNTYFTANEMTAPAYITTGYNELNDTLTKTVSDDAAQTLSISALHEYILDKTAGDTKRAEFMINRYTYRELQNQSGIMHVVIHLEDERGKSFEIEHNPKIDFSALYVPVTSIEGLDDIVFS